MKAKAFEARLAKVIEDVRALEADTVEGDVNDDLLAEAKSIVRMLRLLQKKYDKRSEDADSHAEAMRSLAGDLDTLAEELKSALDNFE